VSLAHLQGYSLKNDPRLEMYQKKGVNSLVKILKTIPSRSAILGSDMGVGKTAQAIRVCDILDCISILVVCPANAKGVWEPEFNKWSLFSRRFCCVETGTDLLPKQDDLEVVIVSYAMCSNRNVLKQIMNRKWDIIICDESHQISNMTSRHAQVCLGNLYNFQTCDPCHLFLSGSVQRNKIIDLHPVFYRCAPDKFSADRMEFAHKYCTVTEERSGRVKISGGKKLGELFAIAATFMVRDTKDVLTNLPPKHELVHYLSVPGYGQDNPDDAAKFNFSSKYKNKFQPYKEMGKMTEERQVLGLAKVPHVISWIKNWREVGEGKGKKPFVVFCLHRSVFAAYREELAKAFPAEGISTIIGGDNKKSRDQAMQDFQSGKTSIFLGSFAASESITLIRAHHLFMTELSWSLSTNEQAPDRVHRLGQTQEVQIYFLLADAKIDRMMWASYQSKKKLKKRVVG
jgi:SWI/SNF-related matrix-associated actin-dependent regulator 1 of chromatin subfamily A